jgi:hypothetical protein
LNVLIAWLSDRGVEVVHDVCGRHVTAYGKRLAPNGARRKMGVVRAFMTFTRLREARRQRVDTATVEDHPGFPTDAVTGGHFVWVPVGDQGVELRKSLGGKRSPMSDDRQLLPLQEIHKTRIHMPYSQLLRLARLGRLPVRKFGKSYYGDPQEVMASLLPPVPEVAAKSGRKP